MHSQKTERQARGHAHKPVHPSGHRKYDGGISDQVRSSEQSQMRHLIGASPGYRLCGRFPGNPGEDQEPAGEIIYISSQLAWNALGFPRRKVLLGRRTSGMP